MYLRQFTQVKWLLIERHFGAQVNKISQYFFRHEPEGKLQCASVWQFCKANVNTLFQKKLS
jgi:hypothetical protein